MKDIKSLFEAAKSSGRENDILQYSQAISESLQTPTDYLSNLEYIISSNLGLNTFKEFTRQYGLSIPCHDKVTSIIERCINTLSKSNSSDSEYTQMLESLNNFRSKYAKCFAMYEYYAGEDLGDYVRTYYSFNDNGIQNRLLLAGMVKNFGEAAIADALITANQFGANAVNSILTYINDHSDPILCEWVTACTERMDCDQSLRNTIKKKSLSYTVESMQARHTKQYQESVITGNTEAEYDYTESEIEAIQDLISFKEYTMTWADEFGIKPESIFEEVNNLYEELDGIITESDDSFEDKDKEELVPIFGIVKSYSPGKFKNNGTEKSKTDMVSTNLKKVMNTLTAGDNYSHAILSFDPDMKNMFSYESKGFVKDDINSDVWVTTDNIYFCVMFIPKSEKEKILSYIKYLEKNPSASKFDYLNMLRGQFGKASHVDNRFVCAAFVAYCMAYSDPKNLNRDYSRMRPDDFTIMPRAFYVMNCRDRFEFNAKKKEFKQRVDEIFRDHKDEIEDYNNYLPKVMLKNQATKLKTVDKILDWIISKAPKSVQKEESINESSDSTEGDLDDLVPIYGIVRAVTSGGFRNNGTEKDGGEKTSAGLNKAVGFLTNGDVHSHAVLSFDSSMRDMYSYQPWGFDHDDIMNDSWLTSKNIYFCVMFVTREERDRVKAYVENMAKNHSKTKYVWLNMLRTVLGKPTKIDGRFICSSFVAHCLAYSDPKNLNRDYSRVRPEDITVLPRSFYVMSCRDRYEFEARKQEFDRRVKDILKEHRDELEDYNNLLPRVMLKDTFTKWKTSDKILDWIASKAVNGSTPTEKE